MAEWPNGGQLPHLTDSGLFDSGIPLPLTQDMMDDQHDQTFSTSSHQHQSLYQPILSYDPQSQPQTQPPLQPDHTTLDPSDLTLDAFFLASGGWRPPEPCNYCRRMRLQCFMLQTTAANPNPVTSCSSCVALFRQCSLAERAKRHHSAFETSAPVIGQLHGVSEEDGSGGPFFGAGTAQGPPIAVGTAAEQLPQMKEEMCNEDGDDDSAILASSLHQAPDLPKFSAKRSSARMVKRTRSLRNWFARHQDHLYPSDDDKALLAAESGLTRTQVTNWFTNARRRQRQSMRATLNKQPNNYFPYGSPMPQSSPSSDMSPLERWRNSPPEQEAISPAALQSALDGLDGGSDASRRGSVHVPLQHHDLNDLSSGASQASSFTANNQVWLDASSNSGSSAYSHKSADVFGFVSPVDRGFSSIVEASQPGQPPSQPTGSVSAGSLLYCTFCGRSFKKKSDWVRHERTIHLPNLTSWVCSLPTDPARPHIAWRVNSTSPCCAYCGHEGPSPEHLRGHEFEACAERPEQERSFARKDHLWQHLQKFHGCQRWEGWTLDLSTLQRSNDAVRSRCGFCGMAMDSWKLRAQHIAAHFRSGLTMREWTGDAGVEGLDAPSTDGT